MLKHAINEQESHQATLKKIDSGDFSRAELIDMEMDAEEALEDIGIKQATYRQCADYEAAGILEDLDRRGKFQQIKLERVRARLEALPT